MRYIDEKYLEIRDRSNKLRDEYLKKFDIWEEAARKSKDQDELETTRPLFDEAMVSFNKWKEHQKVFRKTLFLDPLDQ